MFERLRGIPERFWQSAVLCLAVLLILARFIPACLSSQGDFNLHYGLGMKLVAGEFLYWPGFDRVYPPLWAFVHAPFTFVSVVHAQMFLYPLGVAGMVALVALLKKFADPYWPLNSNRLFWCTTVAVAFAGPFLQRDLVEFGVNTFLVLLTWLGIYLWSRGEDASGAIPLGLAAALKCTPAAFIVYFFWKRQWKFAFASTLMAISFTVLPICVMGTHGYLRSESYWLSDVWKGVSDPNPSRTVLGPDRIGNLSLRTALARYLIHLPYGDPGRPETPVDSLIPNEPPEPLYVDVLTLPPAEAGRVVKIILLFIAAATAWIFRRKIVDRKDPRTLWECAALSIAILLYSPLTWAQHCVGVLPAFYFMFRAAFSRETPPRFVPAVLVAFFIIICFLQRGLIGLRLAELMDAYHLRNFTLLALFWATLRCRNLRGRYPAPREHVLDKNRSAVAHVAL